MYTYSREPGACHDSKRKKDVLPPTQTMSASEEGTYSRQGDLPRLPIPELQDTCAQFLDIVRPLLDAEAYTKRDGGRRRPQQQGRPPHARRRSARLRSGSN